MVVTIFDLKSELTLFGVAVTIFDKFDKGAHEVFENARDIFVYENYILVFKIRIFSFYEVFVRNITL